MLYYQQYRPLENTGYDLIHWGSVCKDFFPFAFIGVLGQATSANLSLLDKIKIEKTMTCTAAVGGVVRCVFQWAISTPGNIGHLSLAFELVLIFFGYLLA